MKIAVIAMVLLPLACESDRTPVALSPEADTRDDVRESCNQQFEAGEELDPICERYCEHFPDDPEAKFCHTEESGGDDDDPDDAFSGGVGSIAVLGCSNTGQHVEGYLAQSNRDLLANTGGLSGHTLSKWATNTPVWQTIADAAPEGGYSAAWFQICLRDSEHDGSINEVHEDQVQAVVDRIGTDLGLDPDDVWISPLNFYVEGHVCEATGELGPAVAAEIADYADRNLGTNRGPDTGPLGPEHLMTDGCHLDASGEQLVGDQLVGFFDDG